MHALCVDVVLRLIKYDSVIVQRGLDCLFERKIFFVGVQLYKEPVDS